MNREIAYRLWVPTIGKMFFPNILPNPTTAEFPNHDGYYMMRTGMKDIKGLDVYEGDIIKVVDIVGEIIWVPDHCAFMLLAHSPELKYYRLKKSESAKVELLGNIYQNREFLEVKK